MNIFSEIEFRKQAEADGVTHVSTGIAIMRDGRVLVVRRAAEDYMGGVYELPGGGVDDGETIVDAAIREVSEETGLTVKKVIGSFTGFDYATDRKPHVRQVNFAVEAAPGDVQLNPDEHDEYVWADQAVLATLTMSDEMRSCVAAVLQEA